ncbi:MAG TPA: 3-deoxy-manno-octulosonate cytidylyltransferase [Phaeodactylibacter sp.]|nr:3-deoxy-manno-octulosonate cytidylyltransferase [Phaeodactylibacter sp.]
MKTVGIIPARYASTRFPGKPLAQLAGRPIIQHVYERVLQASSIDRAVIATDDERIAEAARRFGAEVAMTAADHPSGTDRCAEVAAGLPAESIVVNVQGDEPFISPRQIDRVVTPLVENNLPISTLAKRIQQREALFNSNVVKVVVGKKGRALYFSRSTIPHLRGIPPEQWLEHAVFLKHIGLYGFQRDSLLEVVSLPRGQYEQAESLEQLRWLEAGYPIHVLETTEETLGIDTPEDLEKAAVIYQNQNPNTP